MNTRRTLALAAVTGVLWLGAALPAVAHPAFRQGNAPAGETTTVEFVIPHSCGAEGMPTGDEDQSPTTLIDVQVPAGVEITPLPKDGWTLVTTDDGFEYSAQDPTETTIIFDVELTLSGSDGDALYVNVFQECVDGGSFSWIGTPDRDAEFPAAVLTLGAEAADHEGHGGEDTTDGHDGHGSENASEHGMDDMDDESERAGDEVAVGGGDGGLGLVALVGGGIAAAAVASGFLFVRDRGEA